MNRRERALLAEQTLEILEQGGYAAPSGAHVDLADAMRAARGARRTYLPTEPIPAGTGTYETEIVVENETSLEGARALVEAGYMPAVLNFASAKNPGGGFLSGSQAQEESLARASGLYPLLDGNQMYVHNRAQRDPFYSDHVIYTPAVPVFRSDAGTLLESAQRVAFVTAPAVNAGVVGARTPERVADIEAVMRRRIERVLGVMFEMKHDALVLGAWGCGVFRNSPDLIARLFAEALGGPFRGAFRVARFSVLDLTDLQVVLRPFEQQLSPPHPAG